MGVGALAVLTATLAVCSWQPAAGSWQHITHVTLSALTPRPAVPSLPAASCRLPAVEEPQVKLGEEPADPAKEKAAAVTRAKDHLVKTLEVRAEDVTLESATAATWPDASLGCPEKDRMYAQVITTGYKVVLKVEGKTHEVHVAGSRAVSCPASPDK
jgi:hypothetical protein